MPGPQLEKIKSFVVAEFPGDKHHGVASINVVAKSWLYYKNSELWCKYPKNVQSIKRLEELIREKQPITTCTVREYLAVIKYSSSSYTEASRTCEKLIDQSDLSQDAGSEVSFAEDEVQQIGVRNRKPNRVDGYLYENDNNREERQTVSSKSRENRRDRDVLSNREKSSSRNNVQRPAVPQLIDEREISWEEEQHDRHHLPRTCHGCKDMLKIVQDSNLPVLLPLLYEIQSAVKHNTDLISMTQTTLRTEVCVAPKDLCIPCPAEIPITKLEDIDNLNAKLHDEDYFNNMSLYLKQVSSLTKVISENSKSMINALFTQTVQQGILYDGQPHSAKIPIVKYEKLKDLIEVTLVALPGYERPNHTVILQKLKKYIRGSSDRLGGRTERLKNAKTQNAVNKSGQPKQSASAPKKTHKSQPTSNKDNKKRKSPDHSPQDYRYNLFFGDDDSDNVLYRRSPSPQAPSSKRSRTADATTPARQRTAGSKGSSKRQLLSEEDTQNKQRSSDDENIQRTSNSTTLKTRRGMDWRTMTNQRKTYSRILVNRTEDSDNSPSEEEESGPGLMRAGSSRMNHSSNMTVGRSSSSSQNNYSTSRYLRGQKSANQNVASSEGEDSEPQPSEKDQPRSINSGASSRTNQPVIQSNQKKTGLK